MMPPVGILAALVFLVLSVLSTQSSALCGVLLVCRRGVRQVRPLAVQEVHVSHGVIVLAGRSPGPSAGSGGRPR